LLFPLALGNRSPDRLDTVPYPCYDNPMKNTTTPKGLIPVSWTHHDFAPVLRLRSLLLASLDAMWDTDDPASSLQFLTDAEAVLPEIESDNIRASWQAVIDSDREVVIEIFA
jgi:hypothetical protein